MFIINLFNVINVYIIFSKILNIELKLYCFQLLDQATSTYTPQFKMELSKFSSIWHEPSRLGWLANLSRKGMDPGSIT